MLLLPIGFMAPSVALAQTAAPLLLDSISAAVAGAYAFRKLRAGYAGACVRVRRSSDNAEQDFGFAGGVLDTAALTGFCGAGDGFASKWYDHSTAGQDVAQTVAAQQPQIVAAGALVALGNTMGRPALAWASIAGTAMVNTAFALSASAYAGISVAQVGANNSGTPRLLSFVGAGLEDYQRGSAIFALWSGSGGTLYTFEDGASSSSGVAVGTVPFQAASVFNGSTTALAVNGTAAAPAAVNPASAPLGAGTLRVGLGPNGSAWDGLHAEHLVVAGPLSSADQSAIRASQQSYYGTP